MGGKSLRKPVSGRRGIVHDSTLEGPGGGKWGRDFNPLVLFIITCERQHMKIGFFVIYRFLQGSNQNRERK